MYQPKKIYSTGWGLQQWKITANSIYEKVYSPTHFDFKILESAFTFVATIWPSADYVHFRHILNLLEVHPPPRCFIPWSPCHCTWSRYISYHRVSVAISIYCFATSAIFILLKVLICWLAKCQIFLKETMIIIINSSLSLISYSFLLDRGKKSKKLIFLKFCSQILK